MNSVCIFAKSNNSMLLVQIDLRKMENTTEFQQLINATETLMESNKQLTKTNAAAFALIKENQEKEKKLLAHCGKIYAFLQSKINKTWEEKESMDLLYVLITHA